MTILCSPLLIASSAQALPKDWCGRLWGIRTGSPTILWDNPTTGATSTTAPPNVTLNTTLPSATGTSYASLGIHARSGTLYSLDRSNHTLQQYSMNTGTGWTATVLPQIPNIASGSGVTSAQVAATNFNKMTVTGDKLIIGSSDNVNFYTYDLVPATGALVSSTGLAETYSFDSLTPLANGTTGDPSIAIRVNSSIASNNTGTGAGGEFLNLNRVGGGDIAQDEYGDTYNVTYDNYPNNSSGGASTMSPQYVYFYKKVGTQWAFRGRALKTVLNDQFAGFAFYNDTAYIKGNSGQLFSLPLVRSGSEYNWGGNSQSLTSIGPTGIGVADLATCGVPAIDVTKTQEVFTDAAGTTLTSNQSRIGTGQYIKYTIVGTNFGDAWAKNSYFQDALPAGVTYVPNSATENGVNLNAATYPFTSTTATGVAGSPPNAANTPASGEIRLPFNGNVNTTTYTYIVKVEGTAPSISNEARIGYTNPYPSDPPNCATGLNCGTATFATLNPSIFGTIWNDTNGSANQTFSNIFTTGEAGTNTGTPNALYALLLNSAGQVISSQPVGADGKYAFQALDTNQSNLKIQLSTTTFAAGATPTAASIPANWKSTSPKITPNINLTTADISNQDFGISLPAGIRLVKRITAINGLTTNDGRNLTAVVDPTTTTTTNDDAARKWPAGYLKGAVDAGRVKPGDTIEYTIYYLNDGSADAKALKICDPIRGSHTYVPASMKMLPGGTADTPANQITLTDAVATGVDRANNYAAGAGNVPANCNAIGTTAIGADNGGVAIQVTGTGSSVQPNLPAIPGATANGTPTSSYGWFRFTTRVNP